MMSLAKYSTTSGLRISSAKRIVTSPYITYLSGALNGLCNPDFGHAAAERVTASSARADLVEGATTNVFRSFAFIGSTTYAQSSSSSSSIVRHVPPMRLAHLAAPPVAALILHGFAVGLAHAGTPIAESADEKADETAADDDEDAARTIVGHITVGVAHVGVGGVIGTHSRATAPRRPVRAIVVIIVIVVVVARRWRDLARLSRARPNERRRTEIPDALQRARVAHSRPAVSHHHHHPQPSTVG